MLLLDCIQFQVCAPNYEDWRSKLTSILLQICCNAEPQSMLSFTLGSEVDDQGFPHKIKL